MQKEMSLVSWYTVCKRILIFCYLPLQKQPAISSLQSLGSCLKGQVFPTMAITQLYGQFWVLAFRVGFLPDTSFEKEEIRIQQSQLYQLQLFLKRVRATIRTGSVQVSTFFFSCICLITTVQQRSLQGKSPSKCSVTLHLINIVLHLFWSSHNLF